MNEAEFLRRQVALEARHVGRLHDDLTLALGARFEPRILEPFCKAATEYLQFAVGRQLHRSRALLAWLGTQVTTPDSNEAPLGQALATAAGQLEKSEEILRAATPGASPPALICAELLRVCDVSVLRDAAVLTSTLATRLTIEEWRTLADVDADSILEERRRYAAVAASAPPGVAVLDGGSP